MITPSISDIALLLLMCPCRWYPAERDDISFGHTVYPI